MTLEPVKKVCIEPSSEISMNTSKASNGSSEWIACLQLTSPAVRLGLPACVIEFLRCAKTIWVAHVGRSVAAAS